MRLLMAAHAQRSSARSLHLDAGCGTGVSFPLAVKYCGKSVIGMDIDPFRLHGVRLARALGGAVRAQHSTDLPSPIMLLLPSSFSAESYDTKGSTSLVHCGNSRSVSERLDLSSITAYRWAAVRHEFRK